jgi:hypothetical protein
MLKIEKMPSYLSPSAISKAMKEPNTFYLTRLIEDKLPREPQGLPAAVGSAFDYFVKIYIAEQKFPDKIEFCKGLETGIESNVTEALNAGKRLLKVYSAVCNLEEIVDVEVHGSKSIEYRGKSIPFFGKLDATSFYREKVIPFDWKVSGYSSPQSPKQGFYRQWKGGLPKGAHAKYREDLPFEEIDPDWAFQLCIYGWLLGYPVGTPFYARIDQLTIRNADITLSQFRGVITEQFQTIAWDRAWMVWEAITSGRFIKMLASSRDVNLVYMASLDESWF